MLWKLSENLIAVSSSSSFWTVQICYCVSEQNPFQVPILYTDNIMQLCKFKIENC